MNNLTKLPKNWWIKVTDDNLEKLSRFKRSKGYETLFKKASGYNYPYVYYDGSGAILSDKCIIHGKEITFEQFKEWVLEEKPQEKLLTTIL